MKKAIVLAFLLAQQEPERTVDYYDDIKPLLAIHCVKCHGPTVAKAGLRLDLRDRFARGGDSGLPTARAGKPDESEILRRVTSKESDVRMPPKGERLTSEQAGLLRRWIEQGAVWPEKDTYWAFRRPRRADVPAVKAPAFVRNPIDAFVLARLESRGLRPAPAAEKGVLLRRLFADLIGMPPSLEEAEAFLGDEAPDAYEKLVDRLLADPRYGERWARHWLDLVRYAESDGYENDKVRPHAWRYRDYVIRSLNDDKPYDRFVREQIAGDELYPSDADAIIATGFARLSGWDELCKNEPQRWQDFLNDATDVTGSVFLGLTIGCSRCHDHKYDRITMADYYGLQAFFAAVKRDGRDLPASDREPAWIAARLRELDASLDPARRERTQLRIEARGRILAFNRMLGEPWEAIPASDEEIAKSIDRRHPKRREQLDVQIRKLEGEADLYRRKADVILEVGASAPATRILKRGELQSPGAEIAPRFIESLGGEPTLRPPEGGTSTGRRSELARWIASPENPMTARVIVNRVWQMHFGRGLVATPSDFRPERQPPQPSGAPRLARMRNGGERLEPEGAPPADRDVIDLASIDPPGRSGRAGRPR